MLLLPVLLPAARHTAPMIFDDPAHYEIVGGSIYAYQADRLPRSGWADFQTVVTDADGPVTLPPHDAPEATRFPEPITVTTDGPVTLPP